MTDQKSTAATSTTSQAAASDTSVPAALSNPDGFKYIGQVTSFTKLASTIPDRAGQVILLLGWNEGTIYGGGSFISRAGKVAATDNGMVMPVNSSFYWERIVENKSQINVTHFGALPDGKTDCIKAVQAMFDWTQKQTDAAINIGIQFPAGDFAISSMDISNSYVSRFRVSGAPNSFGYFSSTQLYLIGTNENFAFKVNARQVELAYLSVSGQYDKAVNTRAFFKNICTSGEYIHGNNLFISHLGGDFVNVLDTLDTKFSEFYTTNTYGSIIKGTWSNSESGTWYHITAVELSNFNIQNSHNVQALDLQRCTQSFIKNGWIEKTDFPGDFSNGQWLIEGLSLEGCANPLDLTFASVIMRQMSLQTGSRITYDNPDKTRWLQRYEYGRAQLEAYGMDMRGSMAYSYLHSNLRFRNDSDKPVWIHVGLYTVTTDSDETKIRFTGGHALSPVAANSGVWDSNNFGGGELEMMLRRGPGSGVRQDGSVTVTGSSPLQDIRVWRPYEPDIEIYVQLKPNCGWVNCNIETTAHSHFTAGVSFLWTPDGTVVAETDVLAKATYTPRKTTSWGTLGAGIVIMEDGTFHYQGKAPLDGKMPVNLNGTNYLIPLEAYPYLSDGFMRQGAIGGSRNDNYLGGNFQNTWGVTGVTEGGAVTTNGMLNISQKAAAVIAMGIQLTDYDARFKLVSGPANTASDIQTTFDFRRPTGNTGVDGYRLAFMGKDANGNNTVRLYKRVSSVSSVISPQDGQITDGQTLRVVVKGNQITVYADAAIIWHIVDNSISGGRVAAFSTGANNAGIIISDFKVYEV
ncbi:hypothetical protein [Erwinia sp. ErVv1]|uniref:hypothetical protein n=1 Tax=Erwinia sp. ErVv1 TaxID=1603299 RepID=UPI000ACD85B3|nr:hypothetical protein [Erwinia sp. ErVv1]